MYLFFFISCLVCGVIYFHSKKWMPCGAWRAITAKWQRRSEAKSWPNSGQVRGPTSRFSCSQQGHFPSFPFHLTFHLTSWKVCRGVVIRSLQGRTWKAKLATVLDLFSFFGFFFNYDSRLYLLFPHWRVSWVGMSSTLDGMLEDLGPSPDAATCPLYNLGWIRPSQWHSVFSPAPFTLWRQWHSRKTLSTCLETLK